MPRLRKVQQLIVYLRTIYNPDLLVDITELKNLFAYGRMDFTLVNILQALDEKKISILPGSGMQAISYLRKWRDENPDAEFPDDHFRHIALIREDPGLRSGSAVDYRVGELKKHMMKCARTRARNSIQTTPGGNAFAFEEVNRFHTLSILTSIRAGERDGFITDSMFRNL